VDGKNEIKDDLASSSNFLEPGPVCVPPKVSKVIMEVLGPTGTQMERSHTWSRD